MLALLAAVGALAVALATAAPAAALPASTLDLAPETATKPVGSEHCVTATVRDAVQAPPAPAVNVVFAVSGQNSAGGSDLTDAAGQATFCYTGTILGSDTISAFADTDTSGDQSLGEPGDTATATWTVAAPSVLTLAPGSATNTVGEQHCVTATVRDGFQNPTPNISVRFSVSGRNHSSGQDATDASGVAGFCYTGTRAGADTINAYADTNGNGTRQAFEPRDTASKTYVAAAPATLALTPDSATRTAGTQHCVTATVRDAFQNPSARVRVRFTVSGGNTAQDSKATGVGGKAVFCYTGTQAGTDTIAAFADLDLDGVADPSEPADTAANTYVAAAPAGLTLAPESATTAAGAEHCVTATVRDSFQNPAPAITVRFSVTGAHTAGGDDATDGAGEATFCYTATTLGSDTIAAFADTDSSGTRNGSEPGDTAANSYVAGAPATLVLTPGSSTGAAGDQHCVTATLADAFGNRPAGVSVRFSVSGANVRSGTVQSDGDGKAGYCYVGTRAGRDTIEAYADTDGSGGQNGTEPGDTATKRFKTWMTLSDAGQNAAHVQVGTSHGGDALFVWQRFDGTSSTCCSRVQARTRSSTGALSAVETLSDAGRNASSPQIAVDPTGQAVVVWARSDGTTSTCCEIIQARVRPAGGPWGPVENLSAPGQNASSPQVAIDASGSALVVWARFNPTRQGCCDRIESRARSGGTWGAVEALSDSGHEAGDPVVEMNAGGNAIVAWSRFDGSSFTCCDRIQIRARSAQGTFGSTENLSDSGRSAGDARVAIDSSGDALVAWARFDGQTASCCDRIQTRFRSSSGALSSVQTLSDAGQEGDSPEVEMTPNGRAVFVWIRSDGRSASCCDRVQVRSRSPSGTLGTVRSISSTGQNASVPQLALDAEGQSLVVWERYDGTRPGVPGCCGRIQARLRSSTGVLGPIQNLSAAGQNAFDPAVSADLDGGLDPARIDAFVAWDRMDGTASTCCSRVQAAAQLGSPPS